LCDVAYTRPFASVADECTADPVLVDHCSCRPSTFDGLRPFGRGSPPGGAGTERNWVHSPRTADCSLAASAGTTPPTMTRVAPTAMIGRRKLR
jgi:hypothetical protein